MNIFYLHNDPKKCAEMHLDKHSTKMCIEYAQLMSTAHRVLDGEEYYGKTANGRKIKRWRLTDGPKEKELMKASHVNHPSGIWTRANRQNYKWLFSLWKNLLQEYTFRYGKQHACSRLLEMLESPPANIPDGEFYAPTPAMPDDCKVPGNVLESYHKYYNERKRHIAKWTKREIPSWYEIDYANISF